MADRESNVVAWAGLALASVTSLIAGVFFVASINGRLKSLEDKVVELSVAIDSIAPRQVKTKAAAAPMSLPPEVAAAGPAPAEQLGITLAAMTAAAPAPDPNDDVATWPQRYLADHCGRCPSCCATLSTAALP